jgi:hypothetical protein
MVGFTHPFHTIGETFFEVLAETKVIGKVIIAIANREG